MREPITPVTIEEVSNSVKIFDVKTVHGATCWETVEDDLHILRFSKDPCEEIEGVVVSGNDFEMGGCMLYGGGNFDFYKSDRYFTVFVGKNAALLRIDWSTPESMEQEMNIIYHDRSSTGLSSPVVSPDCKWIAYLAANGDDYSLKVIDINGDLPPVTICNDYDFYAQPVWHPSSNVLLWISWDHPHMPWSQTSIVGASLAFNKDGQPLKVIDKKILYEKKSVALQQPSFSPDGQWLAFVSDESGFSRIYVVKYDGFSTNYLNYSQIFVAKQVNHSISCDEISKTALPPSTYNPRTLDDPCEFCTPLWVEGLRHYQWFPEPNNYCIIATENRNATQMVNYYRLINENGKKLKFQYVDTILEQANFTSIQQLSVDPFRTDRYRLTFSFLGSSPPLRPPRAYLATYTLNGVSENGDDELEEDLPRLEQMIPLHLSISGGGYNKKNLVKPQHVAWTTDDGITLRANFYDMYHTPYNPIDFIRDPDLIEPTPDWTSRAAVILMHGGPTSQSIISWNLKHQYFATRKYIVCDLNYRGSTGYGRRYADAMNGAWGITDVEDVVAAYNYLVSRGVDSKKIFLLGGSSSGSTILNTIGRHPGLFAGAIVSYPVVIYEGYSESLTHKFEKYYNEQLVGSFDNEREKYIELSPMAVIHKIRDPLLLFHGAQDRVVDVEQSRSLFILLKERGVPVEYHEYEDEGHGFKQVNTLYDYYTKIDAFMESLCNVDNDSEA